MQIERSVPVPPKKGLANTPDVLADALVRAVGADGAVTWLDPSAGSGQLVQAAVRAGTPVDSILAIDLRGDLPTLKTIGVECLLSTDFLRWSRETKRRFDRVIANPPFVPIRELEERLRLPALATHIDGIELPGTANYWTSFLVAGLNLLSPGGSIAYVLPAAWEYANYAKSLRRYCANSFQRLEVHRVSQPMFQTVSDGSVLLVGRGYLQRPVQESRLILHHGLSDLVSAVDSKSTWAVDTRVRINESQMRDGQVKLGEVARIRVGAVTGDANFFLLTESRRMALNLPRSSVQPVLSKARHLIGPEIDRCIWETLLAAGERVWMFRPSSEDLTNPAVLAYLAMPEEDGGCKRGAFKIRARSPWYRTRVPEPFDGFISGMSQTTRFVALNQFAGLTASNTLYGIKFPAMETIDEKAAWCLSLMSTVSAESRARLVRRYPQGMLKLEPGDVANIKMQKPTSIPGALVKYREAAELAITGNIAASRSISDEWLGM